VQEAAAPVLASSRKRLNTMPEFRRAYQPDGMTPAEFITFGSTQRTLRQFCEVGWKLIEAYK
jgi:transaldolase